MKGAHPNGGGTRSLPKKEGQMPKQSPTKHPGHTRLSVPRDVKSPEAHRTKYADRMPKQVRSQAQRDPFRR